MLNSHSVVMHRRGAVSYTVILLCYIIAVCGSSGCCNEKEGPKMDGLCRLACETNTKEEQAIAAIYEELKGMPVWEDGDAKSIEAILGSLSAISRFKPGVIAAAVQKYRVWQDRHHPERIYGPVYLLNRYYFALPGGEDNRSRRNPDISEESMWPFVMNNEGKICAMASVYKEGGFTGPGVDRFGEFLLFWYNHGVRDGKGSE